MAETVINFPLNKLPQERHGGLNARHMVIDNTRPRLAVIHTGVNLTRNGDTSKAGLISVNEKEGVDSWSKRDHGDLAMEENDILDQLRDPNYIEHRSYLLDELYSRVNKYAGQVAIENRQDLFLSLAHSLEDYDWEVRQKTVDIIGIVLPHLGEELDHCMDYVLPQVIYNVGDKKVVVRKAAIQTLHLYMQHTSNLSRVFHAFVKYGLDHADRAVNIQATVSLPIFLTSDFASCDIYPVIYSLAVKLCKGQDAELVGATAVTLEALSKKVGRERFNVYIERLPPEIKALYEVKSKHLKDSDNLDLNSNQKGVIDKSLPQEFARSAVQNEDANSHSETDLHLSHDNNILRFGIIPQSIMNGLMDQDDWYGRLTAAQSLKQLISKLDNTSQLKFQFVAFVSFLCQLLEDSNFKVSLVTIEIFQELVIKLNQDIKQYLKPVVSALTKRFGDNKTVIRQANMRVMRKLMQTLEPKPVIDVVSESLRHKKSGVREEALHIIIAALLTFPSNDFDLPKLCDCVAPTLGDPKRKVRQASLETFAVLAQAMGPTKITPLIRAVDGVELQMNDEGVMKAVQARLARRQLPRINAEDMVELPSPLPSSASSRSASSVGFDTVWILKAAGSTGSAKDRSYTDPAIELSQPSPNKSAQNSSTFQELAPPKRFHSAGRGRSKLPWEEDRDDRPEVDEDRISDIFDGTSTGRGQLSSAPTQKPQEIKPPFKPRQTWNGSDPNLFESSVRRQRPGFLNDKQDLWEPPAGLGGSYRQQHLDKMRMMSLAPVKNEPEEHPYNGSHSAPVSDRAGSDPFPLPASYLSKKRDERNMEEIWNERRIVYDTKQKGLRRPKDLSAINKSPRRSFSNSWPDGSFGEDVQPRRNAVSNTPKRAAGHFSGPTAPIPQKATLARSASRSRSKDTSPRDEIIDIDFDDNPLRSPDSDDDLDSANFLQSVRSSAQKKRALKQAKTNKSSSSYQQNYSEPQESAFFNNFTTMNSAVEESGNTVVETSYRSSSTRRDPPDSPFSSKPRIVRSSSGRNPRKYSTELVSRNIDPVPDFNPAGGVTFRDNPNADVTVVGKGYNKSGEGGRGPVIDDTLAAVMNGRQANARERRRQNKAGAPTAYYQGDPDYGEWSSDGSGIRGHGVFGSQQNFPSDQLLIQNKKHGNRRDTNVQHGDEPPEIVGYSYQQNGPADYARSDDEDLEMSMSRAVMDKISQKQEKQRKARKAEKVSREINDDIAEMRKKSLEDERQRLKERNEMVGLNDSLQRTPERSRKYERDSQPVGDSEADYHNNLETEKERLVQQREEQFRAEVEQEKRFRLEGEKRKASAESRRRLQAEEKRRHEEEEYRRLEMEERRIQAEEKQRAAEEKKMEEERRLSEEAEMKRRIQEEEDKYAAEEFEEDPSSDYAAINNVPKTTQKPPPVITTKRKKIKSPKSPGRHGLAQSISTSSATTAQDPDTPPSSDATYDQSDELKPLANPSTALKDALRFLEQDDWEVKNDGLTIVRRLSLYHPEVFGAQLHAVVVAVLAEVKNLRSNVSKCAIACLGDMFVGLNVSLDKELDQICKVIMPKALDGSTFIRNSLDNTLMSMVHNVSPQRALAAIISVGACHNSKMVRKITAQFLAEIVQRMGPGRVLSGIKDVTDKVLITTAKLSLDAYQETRYYARKIVYMLMQHEDFNRLVDRHVPQKDLKSFQEVVTTLRTKGLTEPSSSESLSAKGSRRSLSNSRANSGSNVHYRDKAYNNGSAHEERTPPSSVKKSKRSSARNESQQESVAELVKSLTSSDWKVKIEAVETFQGMCETNPDLVNDNIMKIFDGFCPRLADSNSKVCIVALNTMKEVIPYIADGLPDAIPEVTSKLVKSLASKNNAIFQNSNEIFDHLMDHVDNTLLVQHFAVATKLANARVKPPMIEKLTRLVTTVYPKKPQLITRQILPVLWDVLGNMTSSGAVPGGSGNLRKATKELVMSLYQFMGRGLLQEASSLSQRSKTALEGLIDS